MGDEQAVLVYLDGVGLPDEIYEQYDLEQLENQLTEVIEARGVGMYDGNEFGPSEVVLYMYGPDAEALFSAIAPVLRDYPLCRNSKAVIRGGGPESEGREVRLPLA
jgi:hypothetical protein